MALFKIKLNNKRSRKVLNNRELNTCVSVEDTEVLDTLGTKEKQTITRLDSSVDRNYLFSSLYDLKYIEDYAWKGFPKQRELSEKNKQEWIDDLYLKSLDIIYTNYVASKYGFDYYNNKTHKLIPGKTNLNKVIKRLHSVSGTRINFLSRKLIMKGVLHYKTTGRQKFDYDAHLDQYNYVKSLPRNAIERKLYIPSEWLDYLVQDIISIESKHLIVDDKGNEWINKGAVKNDLTSLLNYDRYKNHKERLLEIIANFKTDSEEALKFKVH